jgi:hypothetical protein
VIISTLEIIPGAASYHLSDPFSSSSLTHTSSKFLLTEAGHPSLRVLVPLKAIDVIRETNNG